MRSKPNTMIQKQLIQITFLCFIFREFSRGQYFSENLINFLVTKGPNVRIIHTVSGFQVVIDKG